MCIALYPALPADMDGKAVVLLLLVAVTAGYSYDLSGIRVNGNKFVNNKNQVVVLRVSTLLVYGDNSIIMFYA